MVDSAGSGQGQCLSAQVQNALYYSAEPGALTAWSMMAVWVDGGQSLWQKRNYVSILHYLFNLLPK